MRWFRPRNWRRRAARYRLEHSIWLSRAVRRPHDYPRIPVRECELGGFDELMRRPGGDLIAKHWWLHAIDRAEEIDRSAR
ncbi:MAG: hypothetical protein ACF8SC_07435 [Phycisphaerales bacterium JB037]